MAPPAQVYVAAPVGAQVMASGQAPIYAPAPAGVKQDGQCCGCIEIRTGMKILFVLSIIQVFWYCLCVVGAMHLNWPGSIIGWFVLQVVV